MLLIPEVEMKSLETYPGNYQESVTLSTCVSLRLQRGCTVRKEATTRQCATNERLRSCARCVDV